MPLYDDSRAAWGAAANTTPRPVAPSARLGVSWHYPGGALTITPASDHGACLRQVKAWQTFHMTGRGWSDIGYNLLICQHARVIEGRGADLVGAHSPGVNVEHYGVQLMTSNATPPTAAMYARAVQLRADLESRSGRKLRQWGHQDDPAAATDCPGPAIESWVRSGGPYATSTTPTEGELSMSDVSLILDKLAAMAAESRTHATQESQRYSDLVGRQVAHESSEANRYSDLVGRIVASDDPDKIAAALAPAVHAAVTDAIDDNPTTSPDALADAVVARLGQVLAGAAA